MNAADSNSARPTQSTRNRLVLCVCPTLCILSLILAPFFQNAQDVFGCWLNWARLTDGSHPWNLYLLPVDVFGRPLDCNYPPFVLYLLTGVQWILNVFSIPQFGQLAVWLVKLPSIVAVLIGTWLCHRGLGPVLGPQKAGTAALLFALCLPVWFNAAIWGQWDAILCLAMLCAVIAQLRGRPALTGLSVGWALSIKFQAIVLLPAMCIYALRTWAPIQIIKSLVAAVATWSIIALPFFLFGAGHGLMNAYFGAVSHYPLLSVCACNGWMVFQTITPKLRDWSFPFGLSDTQALFGSVSCRQMGLFLFAFYTFLILYRLIRRPTPKTFVFAAAMTAFAFFMLPTQMHERYILPACALFALDTTSTGIAFFLAISTTATLNQLIALVYENRVAYNTMPVASREKFQLLFLALSIVQIGLFLFSTARFFTASHLPLQSRSTSSDGEN